MKNEDKIVYLKNCENRCIDDILNMSEYIIEEMKIGLKDDEKGVVLIAANKAGMGKKYVLKHEKVTSACNIYVFTKLCQAIDVSVPECKLFYVPNDIVDERLDTGFVAGIELLDEYNSKVDETENSEVIMRYHCINDLFNNPALLVLAESNNRLYMIGNTPDFDLKEDQLCMIDEKRFHTKNYAKRLQSIRKFHLNKLNGLEKFVLEKMKHIIQMMKAELKEEDWMLEGYYATMDNFAQIPEEYINDILNNLTVIYPDFLAEYYEGYIYRIKSVCENIWDFM